MKTAGNIQTTGNLRTIMIAAAVAVISCTAGCYTPNDDRCSMIRVPTDDPVAYPAINMGQPNIHLGRMHFSGMSIK